MPFFFKGGIKAGTSEAFCCSSALPQNAPDTDVVQKMTATVEHLSTV